MSTNDTAASGGNEIVTRKFAIHCAAAAMPRARARIRVGKISPSSTQTTGPQDAPKLTTKTLAATRATGPHAPGSDGAPLTMFAWLNEIAITASEIVIPAEPKSRIGRRPTRSTSAIAMKVTTMFVTAVMTEIVNESFSWKPTDFQRVVE